MKSAYRYPLLMTIISVFALAWTCLSQPAYDSSNIQDELNLNTSALLNKRGYKAVDYFVVTEDGKILNVVVAGNPLVNNSAGLFNKQVVLFIHGTIVNGTCFITDTPNASPRDYSKLNASQYSVEELAQMYNGSSNAESLVTLLLDWGHVVIIVNRRGTLLSQGTVNGTGCQSTDSAPSDTSSLIGKIMTAGNVLITQINQLAQLFNAACWNFSLDEEVKYDFRDVIYFALNLTSRDSLAVVAWSSGGAITEAALTLYPDLNQKISKALLWSPALYLGRPLRDKLGAILWPVLNAYIGPILPQFVDDIIGFAFTKICASPLAQRTICQTLLDTIVGYGGNQELLKPGFFNSFPAPISSHHLAQLGQTSERGKMHQYDYGQVQNLAIYNSTQPPLYDVSKITSTGLYFWGAANDGLVNINDVQLNVNDLSVPAVFTRFDQPDVYFNHYSYVIHINKSVLLHFPCLRILES